MKNYQPWKLEEGLKLVRALQNRVREFGYHITLGGGVLNKGESDKDLDLYFLPYNNPSVAVENTDGLIEWLSMLWGEPKRIGNYAEDVPAPVPTTRTSNEFPQLTRTLSGQWVVQRVQPPVFNENDYEPVPTPRQPTVTEYAQATPKVKPVSSYKYKLKFERSGGDRIDVFII